MKCDRCDNESVFEVQVFTDDGNKTIRLCKDCYLKYMASVFGKDNISIDKKKDDANFIKDSISDILGEIIKDIGEKTLNNFMDIDDTSEKKLDSYDDKICPFCQTKYSTVKKTGKFGCEHCYDEFSEKLIDTLYRYQGTVTHRGKVPEEYMELRELNDTIKDLNLELKGYVAREEYEMAAKLRDEINELKSDLKKATGGLNE